MGRKGYCAIMAKELLAKYRPAYRRYALAKKTGVRSFSKPTDEQTLTFIESLVAALAGSDLRGEGIRMSEVIRQAYMTEVEPLKQSDVLRNLCYVTDDGEPMPISTYMRLRLRAEKWIEERLNGMSLEMGCRAEEMLKKYRERLWLETYYTRTRDVRGNVITSNPLFETKHIFDKALFKTLKPDEKRLLKDVYMSVEPLSEKHYLKNAGNMSRKVYTRIRRNVLAAIHTKLETSDFNAAI